MEIVYGMLANVTGEEHVREIAHGLSYLDLAPQERERARRVMLPYLASLADARSAVWLALQVGELAGDPSERDLAEDTAWSVIEVIRTLEGYGAGDRLAGLTAGLGRGGRLSDELLGLLDRVLAAAGDAIEPLMLEILPQVRGAATARYVRFLGPIAEVGAAEGDDGESCGRILLNLLERARTAVEADRIASVLPGFLESPEERESAFAILLNIAGGLPCEQETCRLLLTMAGMCPSRYRGDLRALALRLLDVAIDVCDGCDLVMVLGQLGMTADERRRAGRELLGMVRTLAGIMAENAAGGQPMRSLEQLTDGLTRAVTMVAPAPGEVQPLLDLLLCLPQDDQWIEGEPELAEVVATLAPAEALRLARRELLHRHSDTLDRGLSARLRAFLALLLPDTITLAELHRMERSFGREGLANVRRNSTLDQWMEVLSTFPVSCDA